MATEIEVKLLAGPGFDQQQLLDRIAAVAEISAPRTIEQRDVYLDTPEEELAAAGLSARVRERPRGRSVVVKVVPIEASLVMSREENSVDLRKNDSPTTALQKITSGLGLPLRGEPDQTLTLATTRREYDLTTTAWRGELCIDRVRVEGTDAAFAEVEVELRDGSPDALDSFAEVLAGPGLEPSGRSKYLRAREMLGLPSKRFKATPLSFKASTPSADVIRETSRALWAIVLSHESGARVGLDTEHVHKMRVATRRLRTLLEVFEPHVPKDAGNAMHEELSWLARRLGAVRDLDVHRLALPKWRALFGESKGWSRLERTLAREHATAHKRVRKITLGKRYAAMGPALDAMLTEVTDSRPIGSVAPEILRRPIEGFSSALATLRAERTAAAAHRVRIAGKRLRYAIGFLRPLFGKKADAALPRLVDFQDELGALQDAVAAGALARNVVRAQGRGTKDPRYTYVLGQLVGAAAVQARDAHERVLTAVARLDETTLFAALSLKSR